MPNSEPEGRRPSVLIVSAYAAPHLGGVEVVVEQQARTLAELGYQVKVVTSRYSRRLPATEQRDGYEIVRVPAWNVLEDAIGLPVPLWSPSGLRRIGRLARQADLVHVHDVYHPSSHVAGRAARRKGRPLFLTQHVAIVHHDRALIESAQALCYATIARFLWRASRRITVYNPIVERFLTGHGVPAGQIRLTFNGIDTAKFRPGDEETTRSTRARYGLDPLLPVVLFAGRLVPKKGVTELMAAAGPEYQIVLAGPGRIPDQVPDGVRFTGPVERADLIALYQASDIFAFPAVGEMLTLTMQEAMACGLPVVATADEAYTRYQFDPAGLALVQRTPEHLRSTFLALVHDNSRRRDMSVYSRKLAEEAFDWKQNAVDLAADYDDALGQAQLDPAKAGRR